MSAPSAPIPFRIIRRPLLVSGMLATCNDGIALLIDDAQPLGEQATAVWHEIVHMLMCAGGREQHDEAEVEHIARRLCAACPQVLDLCGLTKPGASA